MNKLWLLIVLVITNAAGCSHKSIYNNLLIHQRHECLREPPPDSLDCLQTTYKTFEQYQREREAALNKPPTSADQQQD